MCSIFYACVIFLSFIRAVFYIDAWYRVSVSLWGEAGVLFGDGVARDA